MSDDNIIPLFPGQPVDPPCDTEPREGYPTETTFETVMDDHKKVHNHATDANPNVIVPHNNYGSRLYPSVGFVWSANAAYWVIHTDPQNQFQIPVTLREAIRMCWQLMGFINHKS